MAQMSLDEDIMIGCAFRYALGRMTYVVDSVANEIERRVAEISTKTLARLVREIEQATADNQAGMDMDVKRWLKCRDVILAQLAGRGVTRW